MLPLHVVVLVEGGGRIFFCLDGLVGRLLFPFVVALLDNSDSSIMNSNSFLSLLRRLLGKK